MPITKLSDLIIPENLRDSANIEFVKQFDFMFQGVVQRDPNVGAGEIVKIRGFNELVGDAQDLVSGGTYDVGKIGTNQDSMPILHKIDKRGAEDLAEIISGMKSFSAITNQQGRFWAKEVQNRLLNVLTALFYPSTGILTATNLLSVYVDALESAGTRVKLTPETGAKAMGLLGDNLFDVGVWFMHGAVAAYLQGRGYLETLTNAGTYGMANGGIIRTFMGKPIAVSDFAPSTAGTNATSYRTFLAAPGALALGIQKDINPEMSRSSDKLDIISTDFHFAVGARGVKWNTAALTESETANTILATPTSWALNQLAKNVRIVAIDHNV